MKRFQSKEEKQHKQTRQVDQLMTERNLIKGALLNYAQVPKGAMVISLFLLASYLSGRSLSSLENLLFAFMGMSITVAIYSLNAWAHYRETAMDLRYKRAKYISSWKIPSIFFSLFLYLTLPLGMWPFLTGLLIVFMGVFYSLFFPLTRIRFKDLFPPFKHTIIGLCWSAIVLLPALSPGGSLTWPVLILMAITFVAMALLSAKTRLFSS